MGRPRKPNPPPPDALAAALMVDSEGRLAWRDRPRDNKRHAGRLAGSVQRGRRIVSMRDADGVMRTIAADRVAFVLAQGHYPQGRVAFVDGDSSNLNPANLIETPGRARSPGRRGGKRAERALDMAALLALDDGPLTVSELAGQTGAEATNTRRRLCKLLAQGLVIRPQCAPSRGWLLTAAGRKAAKDAEADLCGPAPPLRNGHAVPWLKPIADYRRHMTDEGGGRRFG